MSTPLPVIVGMGGVNAAGRISNHHAYRRMVIDALSETARAETYEALAGLMGLSDPASDATRGHINNHTLVRRIEAFDPDAVYLQRTANLAPSDTQITFNIRRRHLPESLPEHWQVTDLDERTVRVTATEGIDVLLPDRRQSKVTSAGALPTGFDPAETYAARSHPRGLALAVYGASDTLRSSGLSIEQIKAHVSPDQIAVYSGSAMGQLNPEAYGGLLQNPLMGKRPSSKNCSFGLSEMPGDFVNAYVLGSLGGTAGIIGACATFLYNVKQGMDDIRSGAKRVALIGNSEAPVIADVIEGYRTMGALAEDEALMALDQSNTCDNRRACRPFSDNCGFTVAEGSAWILLMDDALAMELGAQVFASVGDVFVNADGYKKSISGPGAGNYLTVMKAMAAARSMIGEDALRQRTYLQAHGTGTPQNRVTESHILNEAAKQFGIEQWLIGAVKSYLGHTMAPAGGDQLAAILGQWSYGVVPGITTIDHLADDVHASNLRFPFEHVNHQPDDFVGAFVNSKGFGGNNATGFFLSPTQTRAMLKARWGANALARHDDLEAERRTKAEEYDARLRKGESDTIYQFGEGVLDHPDLELSTEQIGVPGFGLPVNLELDNPYDDMC